MRTFAAVISALAALSLVTAQSESCDALINSTLESNEALWAQLELLNSTVTVQQAELEQKQDEIDYLVGVLDEQASKIYRFQVLLMEFRNITDTTEAFEPTTTAHSNSNGQCLTNNGVENCLNLVPASVCCTYEGGGELLVRCMSEIQCLNQNGEYDAPTTTGETTTPPPTTMGPIATTLAPTTLPPTIARTTVATVGPTTAWEMTNSKCLTFEGFIDCESRLPPAVCCSKPEGDDVQIRCTPADQCVQQGGTYPGYGDTTAGPVQTTIAATTQALETTVVETTQVVTTSEELTTMELVQSNVRCFTSFQGTLNCTDYTPPRVCCTLQLAGDTSVQCSERNQCAQQGGSYPALPTTAPPGFASTSVVISTTTEELTTVIATTTAYVPSNTACLTMVGLVNCRTGLPPGVCCNLTDATRCVPAEQCSFQGGNYPELETTVMETTMAAATTVPTTTPGEEITTMGDLATTAMAIQTTLADETTIAPTTMYESTAEWTQSNSKCLTSFQGWLDCAQSLPPGVCCTSNMGFLQTMCVPQEQCEMQGGVYPAVDVTTTLQITTAPEVPTTPEVTTAVADTTLNMATTAEMLTTVAPTTYVSTAEYIQSNEACLTNDQGIRNCFTNLPPGVCCSITMDITATRCMPQEMCDLQGGSYPALPSTLPTTISIVDTTMMPTTAAVSANVTGTTISAA